MNYNSERLYYREFNLEDFQPFYSVFSNDDIMKYAYIDKFKSEEDIQPYFNNVLKNNTTATEDRMAYEYAVYLKTGNCFIGFADIDIHKKNSSGGYGEIGYFLLPEFWGNGYATEWILL